MESIKKMGWGEGLLFLHTKGSVERTYAILVDIRIQGVNFFLSHSYLFLIHFWVVHISSSQSSWKLVVVSDP